MSNPNDANIIVNGQKVIATVAQSGTVVQDGGAIDATSVIQTDSGLQKVVKVMDVNGGGGGGGCIMLRYNTYTNNGTVEALGESGLINYDGYYGGHGGNGLILLDNTNYSMPEKYVVNFSNFNGEIEISENNTYPKTIINNGNIKVYKGSFISYTYNGTTNYTYITQDNMIITP